MFEDDFPFPKVGYVNSLEGTCISRIEVVNILLMIFVDCKFIFVAHIQMRNLPGASPVW